MERSIGSLTSVVLIALAACSPASHSTATSGDAGRRKTDASAGTPASTEADESESESSTELSRAATFDSGSPSGVDGSILRDGADVPTAIQDAAADNTTPDPANDAGEVQHSGVPLRPGDLGKFPYGEAINEQYAATLDISCNTYDENMNQNGRNCMTTECRAVHSEISCPITLTNTNGAKSLKLRVSVTECAVKPNVLLYCHAGDVAVNGNTSVCQLSNADCAISPDPEKIFGNEARGRASNLNGLTFDDSGKSTQTVYYSPSQGMTTSTSNGCVQTSPIGPSTYEPVYLNVSPVTHDVSIDQYKVSRGGGTGRCTAKVRR